MKRIITALLLISLFTSLSEAQVNSKEQNFTQNLAVSALDATTTFSITDAGFLSIVNLNFSAASPSAETIRVYRDSRAGAAFDTLLSTYVTTAGATTNVAFVFGNIIPIAETDQVRITCTNSGATGTVSVAVVLDPAPRSGLGVNIYDGGLLKISYLHHDYHWHFGDVIPDANQSFGAFFSDFSQIVAPANPSAGTRRLFVDSATSELSVRTSGGATVSLEAVGAATSFSTVDVPAGTDPVADSAADTLTITETSPLVVTGTAGTDTIDITWSSVDVGVDGTIQPDSVALTTDTTGNYVANASTSALTGLTGGSAGSEGAALALAWDYTATLAANPALGVGVCVPSTTGFLCEGSSADTSETLITVTNPTADRTFTIPDADSNPVQPLTCGGTDKVSAIAATGAITCTADAGGAGSGDNISVNGVAAVDADFDDVTPAAVGAGVNVLWQRDAGTPNNISGYIPAASSIAAGIVTTSAQAFLGDKRLAEGSSLLFDELAINGLSNVAFGVTSLSANRSCTFQDAAAPIPDSCVGDGVDGGGANSVEVIVDFGATGNTNVSTVVTGQAWVAAGSEISCAPTLVATADRIEGAEDAVLEGITVAAHSRVVGTGFTVTAGAALGRAIGKYAVHCLGV